MAEITKIISIAGEEELVLAAEALVARSRGYTEMIKDENDNDIPNPRSKEDYVLDGIKFYLRQTTQIQAIVDAMYLAFNDPQQPGRDFITEDIATSLTQLVPLCRSQREPIEALRQWLRDGRAHSASYPEARAHETNFVNLQNS